MGGLQGHIGRLRGSLRVSLKASDNERLMRTGKVYLIRHGQAGSRQKYDELSEVGREQARMLGEHLAAEAMSFATVLSGSLDRQRETARIVASPLGAPEIAIDPRWSEFDLDAVYGGIAPQLAAEDEQFARDYAQLQAEMAQAGSGVHRQWTRSDMAVFRAWCEGRFPCQGESFAEFCGRVRAAADALAELPKPAAVFSSATPIGLVLGWTEGISEFSAMQFAGAMLNTAWSELEFTGDGVRMVSFNNVAHLPGEEWKTKR